MERKRNPKLRVLCLHGYMQNKDIFRKKLGSFTKLFKEWEFGENGIWRIFLISIQF